MLRLPDDAHAAATKALADANAAAARADAAVADMKVAIGRAAASVAAAVPERAADQRVPYDARSPWNTPIPTDAAPLPDSAAMIGAIADNGLPLTCDPDQYTIPVYLIDASTPLVTVKGNGYFSAYDTDDATRVGGGSPWTVKVPVPADALAGAGSDGQIVLWDATAGVEWALWQMTRLADGSLAASNGYRTRTGTGRMGRFADGKAGRGAGFPYLAGLVRAWEVAQGRIDHALAFAYASPAHSFIYPASKTDGAGKTGVDAPEGSRLQLDPALDLAALRLDRVGSIIARALQVYGAYVVDNSGSSKVYLEARSTAKWGAEVTRATVSALPWSAFRVVPPPPPVA